MIHLHTSLGYVTLIILMKMSYLTYDKTII